jgi:hypothetical protein
MTTEQIPFLDVSTRKIATIHTRRSSLVECIGILVVRVN